MTGTEGPVGANAKELRCRSALVWQEPSQHQPGRARLTRGVPVPQPLPWAGASRHAAKEARRPHRRPHLQASSQRTVGLAQHQNCETRVIPSRHAGGGLEWSRRVPRRPRAQILLVRPSPPTPLGAHRAARQGGKAARSTGGRCRQAAIDPTRYLQ